MMTNKKSTWVAVAAALGAAAVAWGQAAAPAPAVDPQMQTVIQAYQALNPKPIATLTPAQARTNPTPADAVKKVLQQQGKPTTPEPVAKVESKSIPGPQGNLALKVYTPSGNGPFPMVVYFHGGGFVIANADTYDASARALANQAGAVVVSVNYRQAPEHQFPAALDDAAAAFRYVQKNAAQFNGDPKRVAVAGESAGANLATGVAMRQKASGGAMPDFQLLIYPFVSNDLSTPSHQQFGNGQYLISNDALAWFWKNYLGSGWQSSTDPQALPVKASPAQLQGLPPAMVMTAGLDPLKDEGNQYAALLKSAGVPVQLKVYDGVTHEFFGMAPVLDKAKQAQADAGAALKAAFSQPVGTGGAGNP